MLLLLLSFVTTVATCQLWYSLHLYDVLVLLFPIFYSQIVFIFPAVVSILADPQSRGLRYKICRVLWEPARENALWKDADIPPHQAFPVHLDGEAGFPLCFLCEGVRLSSDARAAGRVFALVLLWQIWLISFQGVMWCWQRYLVIRQPAGLHRKSSVTCLSI